MRILKPIEECTNLTDHAMWALDNSVEIADNEWDRIAGRWLDIIDPDDKVGVHFPHDRFSVFLRELIELERTK